MKTNPVTLHGFFQRYLAVTALTSISLVCLVWFYTEYASFVSDNASIRLAFIDSRKEMLKREVTHVVDYIQYMKGQTENRLRTTIKNRVDEAHAVAMHIYRTNVGRRPDSEIKVLIKDALRPVRFNRGRGYFFAFTLDGIEVLFSDRPEMEEKNMLELPEDKGAKVVRDMIGIILETGQGFYDYTWSKPGQSGNRFRKFAYVRHFSPYNWAIGTGDYVDDIQSDIQEEVLQRIVTLRFGQEGYFFGSTFTGGPLFTNGRITRGGPDILDLTDPNGVKIIQEQKKAALYPEGGFVHYSWPRLDSTDTVPKVSYVLGIPEWQWVIGAGVYLDTIEQTIAGKKADLFREFRQKAMISAGVLFLLFTVIYFWTRHMAAILENDIQHFNRFFDKAVSESSSMDTAGLKFLEFKDIAVSANTMLGRIRQSENRYQTLFQNMIQGVFYQSANGKLTDVNHSALDMLGLSRKEFLDRSCLDETWKVVREDGTPVKGTDFPSMKAMETGKPVINDVLGIYNPVKSDMVWMSINAIPRFSTKNTRPCHVFVTLTDITDARRAQKERQEVQEQLLQAQKLEAVGALSGGIAHDFNNIVAIIMGFAELAMDEIEPGSPLHDNMTEIITAGKRARDLVKQILAFGRRSMPSLTTVFLNGLTEDTVRMLRATTPSLIQMETTICPHELPIRADVSQIRQVLVNLITNATHAIPETGGTICIRLDAVHEIDHRLDLPPGHYARIRVSDTGCGISSEHLDLIFDPYFTTKDIDKGSGLGLSVVHGIVASHGGAINVSSSENEGTSFDVYIPLVTGDETPGNDDGPVTLEMPRGKGRILIVDDEPSLVNIQESFLDALGYTVTTASGSLKALDILRKAPHNTDLLITDMTMPEMSGLALFQAAKKLRGTLPTILCTGFSEQLANGTPETGDLIILMKPVDKTTLALAVKKLLMPE